MAVVQLHPIKRRRYGVEEEWFPVLKELGLDGLRRGLIGVGQSPTVAGNLVWFIHEQVTLDRNFSRDAATDYREKLKGLNIDKVRRSANRAMQGYHGSHFGTRVA